MSDKITDGTATRLGLALLDNLGELEKYEQIFNYVKSAVQRKSSWQEGCWDEKNGKKVFDN